MLTVRFLLISFSVFFVAVNFLRSHEASCIEVVAGYWGQPPEMTENSHEFIMVPGFLKSGKGEGMRMSPVEYYEPALMMEDVQIIQSGGFHTSSRR